jgi:hypothetical protein
MSKNDSEPKRRNKAVVVIVKPYYSPDPNSNNYDQYCQQKLMLHKPFRDESELIQNYTSYAEFEAYTNYLSSVIFPLAYRMTFIYCDNSQMTVAKNK